MGFRPEPTLYTLKFKDGSWLEGLVVKVSACSLRKFNEMLRLQAKNGTELADNNERVLQIFLDHLKEWNLDNSEGETTPMTIEGCQEHEQPVIREILSRWQMAMGTVDDDLGKDSMNGNTSLEQELGLAGL